MDAKQETLDILYKIWTKLQGLPQTNGIDLGGFLIIILFILTVLILAAFACAQCCCRCARGSRNQSSVI